MRALRLLALALGFAGQATGQGYPAKPVRVVVPYPAGGSGDIVARVIGQKMSENWGQQVFVENRPVPFDPAKDFEPGSPIAFVELILADHPSLAASHVRELVALAKNQPAKINYASAGPASTPMDWPRIQLRWKGCSG